MFNTKYKKLLERVKNLEQFFGLAYSEEDDWGEYNIKEWGKIKDIEASIKLLKEKVGIKTKGKFE